MALRYTACLLAGALCASASHCAMKIDRQHTTLKRFEGKMNVPIYPIVEGTHNGGRIIFIWPGVNPVARTGGLLQPVLSARQGCAPGKWCMTNWYSNCPANTKQHRKYCTDKHNTVVEENDVIAWFFEYQGTFPNGTAQWTEGYRSVNHPHKAHNFTIYYETHNASSIFGATVETWGNHGQPRDTNMPDSPVFFWDMKAWDIHGKALPMHWKAGGKSTDNIDCHMKRVQGGKTFTGHSIHWSPMDGCALGSNMTRDFDARCAKQCGCVAPDGTPKVMCDFCCKYDAAAGQCVSDRGPGRHKH